MEMRMRSSFILALLCVGCVSSAEQPNELPGTAFAGSGSGPGSDQYCVIAYGGFWVGRGHLYASSEPATARPKILSVQQGPTRGRAITRTAVRLDRVRRGTRSRSTAVWRLIEAGG